MFKKVLIIAALFVLGANIYAQGDDRNQKYIEKYKKIAIQEMERAGIPASIKLAQALLESGAGKSDLAKRANNHFGIKCGKYWEGKGYYKKDDDYNDRGELIKSCFRVYKNPEASFIAHSEFLLDPSKHERYGFLFDYKITDYKAWAKGLRRAGYATSKSYSRKLIDIIERYKLNEYDEMDSREIRDLSERDEPITVQPIAILRINDVKYVESKADETVEALAERAEVTVREIKKYNENLNKDDLEAGTRVYIQPKRKSYRGKKKTHTVKEGETMFSISQLYAVKLESLYKRNRMKEGLEPAVGESIKLRGWKAKKAPKLRDLNIPTKESKPKEEPEVIFEEEPTTTPPPKEERKPKLKELKEDPFTPVSNPPKETKEEIKEEPQEELAPIEEPKVEEPKKTPTEPIEPKEEETTPPSKEELPFVISPDTIKIVEEPKEKPIEKPVVEEDPFGGEDPKEETTTPQPKEDGPVFHTVDRGDTLWNISQRYQTTVDKVKKLNNLRDNTIRRGMKLRVK